MNTEHSELSPQQNKEMASLGGGCFWCLEAVYVELKGVDRVVSGYTAGHVPKPSYEAVCSGTTGHAEVVQVTFDPNVISFQDILQVFFTIHDPTTLNRQGADVGTQYRSAIYYHSPAQKEIAEAVIKEIETAGVWDGKIVTEVTPADIFYPAGEEHQEYFERNPYQPYCQFVVAPKVLKLRKAFAGRLKLEVS